MDKFVIRKRLPLEDKTQKTISTTNICKPSIKDILNVNPSRDMLYKSNSSGHQVNESRRSSTHYWEYRHKKLHQQKPETISKVLKGVVVYIDGYLDLNMSDLDFKKLIQKHGGEVSYTLARRKVTHLICRNLSASKTQKHFQTKSKVKVVTPNWIIDSIDKGKQLSESRFLALKEQTNHVLDNIF
ncbi:hypothetical protein K7432_006890 [Basidiobolus ranarum]|uniref:BRCT domain-containing protein n=1 Tax=Basidiobolus ranarum TaxID=34480 RepID=A0ABR2W0X5_9FUNG